MQYDEFIGKVQNRTALPSRGDAERLARVVLENLGARIQKGEADDLAAQLPRELGRHLLKAETLEKFDLGELFRRVAEEEGVDQAEAVYRVRAVMEVLMQATSKGEIKDVLAQLPADFSRIFTGAQGQMPNQPVSWDVISQVIDNLHEVLRERAEKVRAERTQAARAQAGQSQQEHASQVNRGQSQGKEERGRRWEVERGQGQRGGQEQSKGEEMLGKESRGRQE